MLSVNFTGLQRHRQLPGAVVLGYDSHVEDAGFHLAMAALWIKRQQSDLARASLQRAIQLDPDRTSAWLDLGQIALRERNWLEAEQALTRATELSPRDAEAHRLLGRIYLLQRLPEQARGHYRTAAALTVPDELFAIEFGDHLREIGEPLLSAEYYRSAMSQGGGRQSKLWAAYGEVLKQLRAWEDLETLTSIGMRQPERDPALSLLRAQGLVELGRVHEADTVLRDVVKLAPGNAQVHYELARVAMTEGQAREAYRRLTRCLELDPYHQGAAVMLTQLRQARQHAQERDGADDAVL
jgi:anaphase-promoting complex subunit 3